MKALIADDQPHMALLLAELLRPWGYEAEVVHDGHAALAALLAPDGPRLALLDWLMPGLDGIEVCRRLRAESECPYAYVVLLTGQGGREPMLDGLDAGADDFLSKPVEPAELRARLGAGRRVVTLQEQLRELATRDALTGLWNRGAALGLLGRELARAGREGGPLAVALADLDHFKHINDTFGHQAGDLVLGEAARRMRAAVRPYDGLGRYGGEEFLAVLPGCDAGDALTLAERLRHSVRGEEIELGGGVRLRATVSLGVAAWDGSSDGHALVRAADEALYRAKRAGRDRVVLGSPEGLTV